MTAERDSDSPAGAYGLRLEGVSEARPLLVDPAPDWPLLRVRSLVGTSDAEHDWMTERAALLKLQNGGEIAIDRDGGSATFVLPEPLRAEELVHPLLAPVAAVTAYWYGRESFHAGAFAVDGRAWGVVGARGAGKSTLVAGLALEGVDIAADDMLVLEGERAHLAPRSVDLRREAAEALGAGEALGVVGARERWRLRLPPIDRPLTIAGWIFLADADNLGSLTPREEDPARDRSTPHDRGLDLPRVG